MVKTFKNLLLWNRKADDLETWYTMLSTKYYQIYSNDAPRLTLTYFTARSNLVPYAFVWDFLEAIVEAIAVYDIKVGRCSQLNEYMKLYEYQRSRSFIDFGPNHTDSIFLNFISSITADFNISSALR